MSLAVAPPCSTAARVSGRAAALSLPAKFQAVGQTASVFAEAPRLAALRSSARRGVLARRALTSAAIAVAAGLGAGLHARRRRGGKRAPPVFVRRAEAATKEKRELNERQEQFWEMLEEDIEEEVVPEFGKESLTRIYEFIKYCKYEKDIPELPEFQEIDPEYFPGLRAKPWWDPAECGEWIKKVEEGLPYVQGELADLLEDNEESLLSDSVQNKVMGAGWSGFRLQRLGDWLPKNCEQFPQTVQLLKEAGAPLAMRGVIVARQVPGSGVAPHSDGRNIFLTAHFGLSVPEDCNITVGGETRDWVEDGTVVLDTSFVHSTKNNSDEDRFVLIVDFWHPDLTVPEQEALEYIYDFRTKFEQGKIKYSPKMPTDFFKTLELYSAWGGAYTEEKVGRRDSTASDSIGGFTF